MALKDMKSIFGLGSPDSNPKETKLKSDVSIIKSIFGRNNLISSISVNKSVAGKNNLSSDFKPIKIGDGLAKK